MSTITFSAVCRRFERSHKHHSRISKLKPAEIQGFHGSQFAWLDGNTIQDVGDLAAVEGWCRAAGVLHHHEMIVA